MKKIKLDDIEKENIFRTPPDYFEDLPSIIQAKAVKSASEAWYLKLLKQPAVKFARLPAVTYGYTIQQQKSTASAVEFNSGQKLDPRVLLVRRDISNFPIRFFRYVCIYRLKN